METDFRALLATDPTIIDLVATRIFPSTYAQGATDPAIRYLKVTSSIGLHTQGSDGLTSAVVQVDVRATTAAVAISIRDAIVALLHGFKGQQGATDFKLIALQDDRGIGFENTGPQSFYTASLDFDVRSRAAA
jgi:hypothetical protein